ncbi:6-phosphogluconolactonase [bacterium]|nr:6-phosphogluconolactonase [bacterium]NIN91820.1 6-phosphogluconolactonase [bacterium]NIO18106.1 6-phosphogluconolactonase [bacterium]NIO73071.1 6-phosphogluconolactonase [bacterium]
MEKMVNSKRNILIFDKYDQISDFAVKKWEEISRDAIKSKDFFAVALSGGKTPAGFYEKLSNCRKGFYWNKTHLFLVDEHFVPFDHEESNYQMIKHHLLDSLRIPMENFHSISTQEDTPEKSSENYQKQLKDFFQLKAGEIPTFDLVMLGIGEDGHIASLFPRTSSLRESGPLVVAVSLNRVKNKRISITLPVINNAKNIIFLVSGYDKAQVIKEILEEKNMMLPASRVDPEKGQVFFLMDKKAASLLSSRYV